MHLMTSRVQTGLLSLLVALLWVAGTTQPVHANLNIFGKPDKRDKGKKAGGGGGFSFGTINLNKKSGIKYIRKADNLYVKGDYAGAAMEYYQVVANMRTSRWFPLAQHRLAKSLYRMKLPSSSLHTFEQIMKAGRQHPQFRKSLGFTITLLRQLKDDVSLGQAMQIPTSDAELSSFGNTFPRQYRAQMLFLLGRYYFSQLVLAKDTTTKNKHLNSTAKLLNQIRSSNALDYSRSRYILGVVFDLVQRPNSAARSFNSSILAARKVKLKKEQQNILELNLMSLARIHYGSKHFSGAIRYYNAIPRESSRWLDSLFERAWAYARLGRYEEALGILHTLDSPYFRDRYYPENDIIRAVSYLASCRYNKVKQIYRAYLRRYTPLINTIRKTEASYRIPGRLYEFLQNRRRELSSKGLAGDNSDRLFTQILNLIYKDKPLRRLFHYIKQVEKELEQFKQTSAQFRGSLLGRKLLTSLVNRRKYLIKQSEARTRRRMKFAAKELVRLKASMLKIYYETLTAEKQLLRSSSKQTGFDFGGKKTVKKNKYTVAVNSDFVYWPFRQEYWVDELGYYRYRIKGECQKP
jgi:hypothetical protein